MGNCIERRARRSPETEDDSKKEEKSDEALGKVRTVVLTQPEFEWLMKQLEQKPVNTSLEALLAQMPEGLLNWERWRPALNTIMEAPELQSVESSIEQLPPPSSSG